MLQQQKNKSGRKGIRADRGCPHSSNVRRRNPPEKSKSARALPALRPRTAALRPILPTGQMAL